MGHPYSPGPLLLPCTEGSRRGAGRVLCVGPRTQYMAGSQKCLSDFGVPESDRAVTGLGMAGGGDGEGIRPLGRSGSSWIPLLRRHLAKCGKICNGENRWRMQSSLWPRTKSPGPQCCSTSVRLNYPSRGSCIRILRSNLSGGENFYF